MSILALVGLIAAAAYFALRRDEIPYEALAARYGTAASRYADLPGGVHLHYRDEGATNGPALLLVHGFSASLETWSHWAARLGDDYRVISIDLPGHGLTRAPKDYDASVGASCDLIQAFAEVQKLNHFTIAGNSLGGHVAWEYTLAHPERVDALVLVDASGWPRTNLERKGATFAFTLLRNPAIGHWVSKLGGKMLVQRIVRGAFADRSLVTEAMVRRYVDLSRAPGHREIMLKLMLDGLVRQDLEPQRLAPIAKPTLIIWGERDNIMPIDDAHSFRNAIADSQLITYENVGHFPQEEFADASAAAARTFLLRVCRP
jgi:pimeloyl-ACP methyl ester carboxylesterase